MLELSRVAALLIDQWGVCIDNALGDQVVQSQQVLVLAEAVKIAATEWEGAEGLVDDVQDVLRRGKA